MNRKQLWFALFVRWAFVSLLCLLVAKMYNNNNPFWHVHVLWVSNTAMWMFWVVQVIHIIFLVMIGSMFVLSRISQKSA